MSMTEDAVPTVSVDAEGGILGCAKGIDLAQCGYVKGDKVCGKCGAVPVEMKVMPASVAEELLAKVAKLEQEVAKSRLQRCHRKSKWKMPLMTTKRQ